MSPTRAPGLGAAGSALAEMAILLPFYMVLLLGVIDFCRVFYAAVAVTQAARAGTQLGVRKAIVGTGTLYPEMRQAATNVLGDYGLTVGPTPAVQRYCVCSDGTPPACPVSGSNTCPPSDCPTNYQIFMCTSTSYDFSTFATYPGIPSSVTLVRTAMIRAQ